MMNKVIIFSIFIFFLASCKTQLAEDTNKYTTPPEIGRLTTDLPKKNLNNKNNYPIAIQLESDLPKNQKKVIINDSLHSKNSKKRDVKKEEEKFAEIQTTSTDLPRKTEAQTLATDLPKYEPFFKTPKNEIEQNLERTYTNNNDTIKEMNSYSGDSINTNESSIYPSNLEKEPQVINSDSISNTNHIHFLNTKEFVWEIGIRSTQIIDIRSFEEFKSGHIYDAINIDFDKSIFKYQIMNLDKISPVAIYCNDGTKSVKAAKVLEDNGFSIIYILKGGIQQWIKDKKELVK